MYTTDTEIFPFNGETMYGSGINGNITFNSDTSLVRVILSDSLSGMEYMIYETYPMLDTIWNFSFSEECEESCYLDGFNPTSLKIQIVDASFYFDDLKWSSSPVDNATEMQLQAKYNKEQEKINEINAFISKKKMLWVAGENLNSNMYYYQRKKIYGPSYISCGFEFYKGGIFEFYGYTDDSIIDYTYNLNENFDWRKIHNANVSNTPYWDENPDPGEIGNGWMTAVKCQNGCYYNDDFLCNYDSTSCVNIGGEWRTTGACTAFATLGMLEAVSNLYFNRHLDFNLSEQELASTKADTLPRPCGGVINGGYVGYLCDYITEYGVVNESCFPFKGIDVPCNTICEEPDNIVSFKKSININNPTGSNSLENEVIKKLLINNGPVAWSYFMPSSFAWHAMTFVGYDVIDEGDTVYMNPYGNSIIIQRTDLTYIGKTYYIFKNSSGSEADNNGYIYMLLAEKPKMLNAIYTDTTNAIISTEYDESYRLCLDEDNDGYYNWGLGLPPANCSGEEDGNDNNPGLGPRDENGFCKIIGEYNAGFENDLSQWKQVENDNGNWLRYTGESNSPNPPLPEGHIPQGAQEGNYYLWMDGFNLGMYKTIYIESPLIDYSNYPNQCTFITEFWFNRYVPNGAGDGGMLELQASQDGGITWDPVWGFYNSCDNSLYGDCKNWNFISLELPAIYNKLRFKGKVGFCNTHSSIALDNITIKPNPNQQNSLIINSGSEMTFYANYHACGNIIIKPNAKLIISNSTLFMPPGSKIIVERGSGELGTKGGYFKCSGGTVTSDGNYLWKGIEVWGYKNQSQTVLYQGKVYINNGTIKNAECAIKTVKMEIPAGDAEEVPNYNYTGGIVESTNSNFINNKRAIHFYPYESYMSLSKITNTVFEVNDDLPNNIQISDMVLIQSINNPKFFAPVFRDLRTGINLENRAVGINSDDATIYIDEKNGVKPAFIQLCYGINATVSSSDKSLTIKNSQFSGNYKGLYISGMEGAWITSNNFDLNTSSENLGYGMYLDNCNGYKVEDNTFLNSDSQPVGTGLIVHNSGPQYNIVYNNFFRGLEYGIIAQDKNRDKSGETGLVIKCNDYDHNYQDVAVTAEGEGFEMGLQESQGNNGPETTDPAGNTFSYTGGANKYSDYLNETDNNIIYWYHYNQNGFNIKPEYYSIPEVNPQTNLTAALTYIKEQSCPPDLEAGEDSGSDDGAEERMVTADQKADSVQLLLDILVDGGNTQALTTDVQNSYPPEAWELYVSLLGKSPFLSDTIMKSAINKENVLPPEMVTDILVANPQSAKSNEVLTEVENRIIPLSDEQKEAIMQNWYITGAKESLETKLAAYKEAYTAALYDLLEKFRYDTTLINPHDSIIAVLENENSLWAKYTLISEYIATDGYTNATNTLNSIPTDFELTTDQEQEFQDYCDVFGVLAELQQQGRTIYELDSLQKQTLYSVALKEDSRANAWARSVLLTVDTLNYLEPVLLPTYLKSSAIIPIPVQKPAMENKLFVYPNPAKDYFIVRYELNNNYADVIIQLTDISGRTVKRYKTGMIMDYLIVQTNDLKPDNYFVKLILNGKEVGVQKVAIQ